RRLGVAYRTKPENVDPLQGLRPGGRHGHEPPRQLRLSAIPQLHRRSSTPILTATAGRNFSMINTSIARRLMLGAAAVTLVACMDPTVPNNNHPDRVRATSTPGDVQALIAGTFQRWWPNVYSTTPTVMFGSMGYEFSTPFLCFAGQPMEQEPRPAWNNNSAFTNANVSATTWLNFYGVISLANDGLQALD